MHDKDFQATTEYIKEISQKFNAAITHDVKHHYELRRSLLGCNFYHKNFVVRSLCRVKMYYCGMFKGASLVVVLIVLVSASYPLVRKAFYTYQEQNNNMIVKEVNAKNLDQEYVQQLYTYGYLTFDHENTQGSRVYKARVQDKEINVFDNKPYTINMVVAR